MTNDSATITRNTMRPVMAGTLVCCLMLSTPWLADPSASLPQEQQNYEEKIPEIVHTYPVTYTDHGLYTQYHTPSFEPSQEEIAEVITGFAHKLIKNMSNVEPKIMEKLEEHFWELV